MCFFKVGCLPLFFIEQAQILFVVLPIFPGALIVILLIIALI